MALVERASVSFAPGLNVITGESGTGKSMILHALELAVGGRPRAALVRDGASSLEVEALFSLEDVPAAVRAELPDIAQTDEVLLARSIDRSGRSKVHINGRLGTIGLLEEIGTRLLNICGQNQHVRLLEPKFHLDFIDEFGATQELRLELASIFLDLQTAKHELAEREMLLQSRARREAELTAILEDLKTIELRPGIRAELEAEVRRVGSGEALLSRGAKLDSTINDERGLLSLLSLAQAELSEMEKLDPGVSSLEQLLSSAKVSLEELGRDLASYTRGLEIDDEKLNSLRDHLAEVARFERKYRTDDRGLCELREQAFKDLAAFSDEAGIEAIQARVKRVETDYRQKAATLSKARRLSGERLSAVVQREFKDLGLSSHRFKAEFSEIAPSARGVDHLEFMLSPDSGKNFFPLRKTASGGELSRITLALKSALKESGSTSTFIFDEVDTGVSGSMARSVGTKLKTLSRSVQVICITHLPQIASLADVHLLVSKDKGTSIRALEEGDKVNEIARMLSGHKVTPASLASARELLTSNS